jgi:hypothetical protein
MSQTSSIMQKGTIPLTGSSITIYSKSFVSRGGESDSEIEAIDKGVREYVP